MLNAQISSIRSLQDFVRRPDVPRDQSALVSNHVHI